MSSKIGTVFNYNSLPDVSKFPFIIDKKKKKFQVRKGLFVYTDTIEGMVIGIIDKIIISNEYFSDALTIKAYNNERNPDTLRGLFPSDDFEFSIAIVRCLGLIEFKDKKSRKINRILRMTYPATPGAGVFNVEEELLLSFVGLDNDTGLNLGKIKITEYDAHLSLNRLLNKHFAILSISGGGKSYLTSIIIEELLKREKELGTPAIVLIDVHGEYQYLKDIPEINSKINIYDTRYFQFATSNISAWTFKKYQKNISHVQVRELNKYIETIQSDKEKRNKYTLADLIDNIDKDDTANKNTKQALIGWLSELEHLQLFGTQENPIIKNISKQGELSIFSLHNEINIRKKQIIIDYICNRLFYLRRMNKIPPFLLILEEAHQFCPEAAQSKAISKNIIETIAREGRKFMACLCLISQRPKKLSTTVLSQMNSKLILRIQNPYDLSHLMDSSEAITKEYADMISSLGVGEMLVMGNAVNYPVFIDVRERTYHSNNESITLSKECIKWQETENL